MLKHKAFSGQLDVRCNDERPATYVYDQSTTGTVINEVKGGTDWNWMGSYNKEVMKLEKQNKLIEDYDLPLLEIDYPYDYTPNALGTSDMIIFNVNTKTEEPTTIKAPANSSRNHLLSLLSRESCGCHNHHCEEHP